MERPWDLRRHPLWCMALFAALGSVVGRYAYWSPLWSMGVVFCLWVLWMGVRHWWASLASYVVLCIVAATFAAYTWAAWNYYAADDLGLRAPGARMPIVLEAKLVTAPRVVDVHDPWAPGLSAYSYCVIAVQRVRDGAQWRAAGGQGRLLIMGRTIRRWNAGDRVRIYGHLMRFPQPANPGEVSRRNYFRLRRQLFQVRVMSESSMECLEPAPWWSYRRQTESLREAASRLLERAVDPQWFPLAAALVLGARHHLDWQTLEPFLQTGTIHVLAISGLHVGMLVYVVFSLLRCQLCTRSFVLWLAVGLVVFYAVLTTGQPPVVRAAMLSVGVCLARLWGRYYSAWNLWGAGAMTVLAYNPLQLFDVGAQLSFLAVAALIAAPRPPWQKPPDALRRWLDESLPWWQRVGRWMIRSVSRCLWSSLIVWLVTLPLLVWRFHRASPVAVFVNPFLWVPIATSLLSGFAVLLVGPFSPAAANLCGWLCQTSLWFTYHGIVWTDQLVGAHLWLSAPHGLGVAAAYAMWLWWLVAGHGWRRWAGGLWVALAVTAVVMPSVRSWWGPPQRDELRCTFFAVGHGTCVLIELPCGKNLLYDTGRFGSPWPLVQYLSRTIWTRRIGQIDMAIVSHADTDHFNGLPGLVDRIRVRDVALPCPLANSASHLTRQLDQFLSARQMPIRYLAAGEVIRFPDSVTLEVLHPPVGYQAETDNAGSIVLCIRYAGRAIVLPGDLEGSGQRRVMTQQPFSIDVLMSPHHASANSNHGAWAQWAAARHVIICDHGPLPTSTQAAYQSAGSRIWYTQDCGAVELSIRPDGSLRLHGFRVGELCREPPPGTHSQ